MRRSTPLKADPAVQLKLLDLQELDSRADLLRYQRGTLPEHDDLAALTMTRQDLGDQARDARIVVDDLVAEQTKVDSDVEQVRTRRDRDRSRMDQGLVSNPKDLERMQHEMTSLERRIVTLEDEELEVMARLEDAQRNLDELTAQLAEAEQRNARLEEARDAKYAEIDAELATLAAQRGPLAEEAPADLMALYDRLRAAKNGVGAATLRARQCSGCMLGLDNAEVGRSSGRPPTTRCCAARSASGSWCARRSPACERPARRRHRGRRRVARQPRPGGVRRGAQGRRHRRGDRRGRHPDRGGQQQRGGVPRPDRGPHARGRARAGRRHRGPDGLQARGRADVGQLEDQAPGHEAAGAGGQPARAVRHDVHLGAARAEQARRPARQRGARRQAARRHRGPRGQPGERGRSDRGDRRRPRPTSRAGSPGAGRCRPR